MKAFQGFIRVLSIISILLVAYSLKAQEMPAKPTATIFINETDTLNTEVDSVAAYPGGPKAWAKFLNKTMRYPQEAQDNEIMGKTLVMFIVDVDGTVSDVRAISGDPILGAESKRVIEASGKWQPVVYQGRQVKAYHIQPLVYKLEIVDRPRRRSRG